MPATGKAHMEHGARIGLMEAAHRLGVDYHVARRLVLTRALKAERIDGHWYVDARDLERYQRDHQTQGASNSVGA